METFSIEDKPSVDFIRDVDSSISFLRIGKYNHHNPELKMTLPLTTTTAILLWSVNYQIVTCTSIISFSLPMICRLVTHTCRASLL